jgi:hypothetical protein
MRKKNIKTDQRIRPPATCLRLSDAARALLATAAVALAKRDGVPRRSKTEVMERALQHFAGSLAATN